MKLWRYSRNGYTFIKREGDNSTLLFLEDETGIVRDYFSNYGLLGTMPCYHDNITENAWKYGDTILNKLSNEYKDLKNIFSISILSSVFVEGGAIALEGITGLSLGVAALVAIPLFIILFPDETNELWKEFIYLLNPNYKDYLNITIYEGIDYNTQKLFDKNPTILVLNGQSLEDYVKFQFNNFGNNDDFDWENVEHYACIEVINFNYKFASRGPKPINESFFEVGKSIKENYDLLLENIEESNYKGIIIKAGWIGITIYIVILTILNYFKNILNR